MRATLGLILLTAVLAPLNAAKQITITRLVISHTEDDVAVPTDYQFVPGETVFVALHTANYTIAERDDISSISLTYRFTAKDGAGRDLVPAEDGRVLTDVAPEDKNWSPKMRWFFIVPPMNGAHTCHVTAIVTDDLNRSQATLDAPFFVQSQLIEPSPTLTVRNFRFLRGENDRKALTVPAYRPGDTVWGRFDMIGFQVGEKNRFDVAYGLSVLRPNGETMFSEPHAAEAAEEPFYPEQYTGGILSLNLTPDLKPGEYTIVLTLEDRLSGKQYQTRHQFRVE